MKFFFLVIVLFSLSSCLSTNKDREEEDEIPTEKIIQALINHKDFNMYFHPSTKGRSTLHLADHLVGTDLKLKFLGKEVKIITGTKESGAYIRFTEFDCKDLVCKISFEYPIEGVLGQSTVRVLKNGSFTFKELTISER